MLERLDMYFVRGKLGVPQGGLLRLTGIVLSSVVILAKRFLSEL